MTTFLIWLIAFGVIACFVNEKWNSGVSRGLDRMLPTVMKSHGSNRYLWVGTLAVLGATTLIRPVEVLLVVILLVLVGLVIMKLAEWASNMSH